jgi:exosortase
LAASRLAAMFLWAIHAAVILDGNILQLRDQTFSVDEACNGIRFLLSLGFLAMLYAYRFDQKAWMRGALLLMVIPLAIAGNALRVAGSVLLGSANPALSSGGLHTLWGLFIFAACLTALAAIRALFNFIHAHLDL